MQLSLPLDDLPRHDAVWSPPLCPVPDTTYRTEVRFLWNPLAQRGVCAVEITDDDTRELILWELLVGAHSLQDLADGAHDSVDAAMDRLRYLDEPF